MSAAPQLDQAQHKGQFGAGFQALLAEIDPDNSQNPRSEIGDLTDLQAGLAYTGNPYDAVLLQKHDNPATGYKWRVRAGHRRVASARELKWQEIPAREFVGSLAAGLIAAIAEQDNRKELRGYDRARHFVRIKSAGKMSTEDLVRELKAQGSPYGDSTVRNLVHAYEALTPVIREEWAKGHAALTDECVLWLVGVKPATKQLEQWALIRDKGAKWKDLKAGLANQDTAPKTKVPPIKPASTEEIDRARTALRIVRLPKAVAETAAMVLAWCAQPELGLRIGGKQIVAKGRPSVLKVGPMYTVRARIDQHSRWHDLNKGEQKTATKLYEQILESGHRFSGQRYSVVELLDEVGFTVRSSTNGVPTKLLRERNKIARKPRAVVRRQGGRARRAS